MEDYKIKYYKLKNLIKKIKNLCENYDKEVIEKGLDPTPVLELENKILTIIKSKGSI